MIFSFVLREIVVIYILALTSIQVSSLVRRLLLVPLRIILIFLLNINIVYSGFLGYVFIIIFIGGLIVLLVRVSSLIKQDQIVISSLLLMVITIPTFLFNKD